MNIDARALSVVEYKAIKDATRRLVEENGGLDASAERTRISSTHLQRCASNFHDNFLTVDVVMDLERSCGSAPVTERMARLAGYVLQRIPSGGDANTDAAQLLVDFVKETRDVEIGFLEAVRTNGIDADEALALLSELEDSDKVHARLRTALTKIVMRGGDDG